MPLEVIDSFKASRALIACMYPLAVGPFNMTLEITNNSKALRALIIYIYIRLV